MKNDFIPVINRIPIDKHPKGLTLIPLADAHYGSAEFNETLWHRTIKRIQDDPDCYCCLVGDLIDNTLKSSPGSVFEATASPGEQKEWLYNELLPIKDKILGAVGGNHERRTSKEADNDPLYDVMLRLGREDVYRQNICFMQIRMTYIAADKQKGRDKTVRQRVAFSFAITHGAGGGQYIGSSANRVQNFGMAIEGIDCLITAHTHKPVTFPVTKLLFNNGTIVRKQFVVAVASSFLNYGGYPVQKLLPPTAQTTTEIMMSWSGTDGRLRVMQ